MSYLKREGFVCDGCGDAIKEKTFEHGKERMREEEWKTIRVNEEWLHYCSVCKEDL